MSSLIKRKVFLQIWFNIQLKTAERKMRMFSVEGSYRGYPFKHRRTLHMSIRRAIQSINGNTGSSR